MISVELCKQLPRQRTWLTLLALAAFAPVMTIALSATGADRTEFVGDIPLLLVPGRSGFSLPLLALSSTMKFFLPLAVAVFAGEAVAGESGWGSLRYELGKGVARWRLLGAKAAVAALLSGVAVAVVPLAALVTGLAMYGAGPLTVGDGGAGDPAQVPVATFTSAAALLRLGLATAYVVAGMTSVFAFALFLSTVTSRALVAVAGGVGLTMVSRLLNADYLPGVAVLNPYMPNNEVDLLQHLFQQPMQTDGMLHFLLLQLVYGAAFLCAAWWWFSRKDILT